MNSFKVEEVNKDLSDKTHLIIEPLILGQSVLGVSCVYFDKDNFKTFSTSCNHGELILHSSNIGLDYKVQDALKLIPHQVLSKSDLDFLNMFNSSLSYDDMLFKLSDFIDSVNPDVIWSSSRYTSLILELNKCNINHLINPIESYFVNGVTDTDNPSERALSAATLLIKEFNEIQDNEVNPAISRIFKGVIEKLISVPT